MVHGRKAVLVDDVISSGTTLARAVLPLAGLLARAIRSRRWIEGDAD